MRDEALKVIATGGPLLMFVWAWSQLISTPYIRRVFIVGSLAMLAGMYAYIAWRYWL